MNTIICPSCKKVIILKDVIIKNNPERKNEAMFKGDKKQ